MAASNDILAILNHALGDRYVLEREIGRGGMATVYLAEDLKHRRKVAIKVMHAAVMEMPQANWKSPRPTAHSMV